MLLSYISRLNIIFPIIYHIEFKTHIILKVHNININLNINNRQFILT